MSIDPVDRPKQPLGIITRLDRAHKAVISTHLQREFVHQQIGSLYFLFEVWSPFGRFLDRAKHLASECWKRPPPEWVHCEGSRRASSVIRRTGQVSEMGLLNPLCMRALLNDRIHRVAKRDRVDDLSQHPLSWLLGVSGAPLNKCPACRLQYYDWHPPGTKAH